MNFLKQNKHNIFNVLFLLFIWLLIPVLAVNKGFYYSETHENIVVKMLSEKDEDLKKALDLFNYSKIDREHKTITYERIKLGDLAEKYSQTFPANENGTAIFSISQINNLNRVSEVLLDLALTVLIMFITFALSSFYIIYRNSESVNFRFLSKIFSLVFANIIVSTFLFIGILSIFSRFYQIKVLDLNLITILIFSNIFISIRALNPSVNTFNEFFIKLRIHSLRYSKLGFIFFNLLVIPMLFALGYNFVLTYIFLFMAILLPLVSVMFTTNIVILFSLAFSEYRKSVGERLVAHTSKPTKTVKAFSPRQKKKSKNRK